MLTLRPPSSQQCPVLPRCHLGLAISRLAPLIRRIALPGLLAMAIPASAADLTVSAAASLANAFKALAPAFAAQHPGTTVQFNFAASDALLAQIAKGAPVDVFASADEETMNRADAQHLLVAGSRQEFTGNTLVLVVPADRAAPPAALADLQGAAFHRLALGRPDGVPAGRYAQAAIEAAHLWSALEPKLVFAQNVRQALEYVARGEADAGFVYASDASVARDKVKVALTVPTTPPITYPVAAVSGGQAALARQFIDFLRTPASQQTLQSFGFRKP